MRDFRYSFKEAPTIRGHGQGGCAGVRGANHQDILEFVFEFST